MRNRPHHYATSASSTRSARSTAIDSASYRIIAECLFGSARSRRRAVEMLVRSRRDFDSCAWRGADARRLSQIPAQITVGIDPPHHAFRGGELRPQSSPSPRRNFFAKVIDDSRRCSAARFTSPRPAHVRCDHRSAATLLRDARSRAFPGALRPNSGKTSHLRHGVALLEARRPRRLSTGGFAGRARAAPKPRPPIRVSNSVASETPDAERRRHHSSRSPFHGHRSCPQHGAQRRTRQAQPVSLVPPISRRATCRTSWPIRSSGSPNPRASRRSTSAWASDHSRRCDAEYGMATIWDADIDLGRFADHRGAQRRPRHLASDAGDPRRNPHLHRPRKMARDYDRSSRARSLQSTTIETSIRQPTERWTRRFSWINEWKERAMRSGRPSASNSF